MIALPDTALEGDEEVLCPARSNPTLHVGAGDRLELPTPRSVIVEERLKPAADILPPTMLSRTSTTLYW
jgi:hypothetical protein